MVRAELVRVLGSRHFANAPSLSRFLAHIVELALQGRADSLKEYSIGVDVFDRGHAFDPKVDTIVRTQARRLRLKLEEYYRDEGRDDPVAIELAKGHYAPQFSVRHQPVVAPPAVEPRTQAVSGRDVVRRGYLLALAALVVLAVSVAGAKVALSKWSSSTPRVDTAAATSLHSLAVLPFKLLDSANGDEYLGIGMADSLISRLGLLRDITVRPLASVQLYADGKKDPSTAGRELQVESVLDGSVQKDGERLRVRVRLYRVNDGRLLWADQFDQDARDIFAVQDSISDRVAAALSQQLASRPPRRIDPEAYEDYVRGRYFFEQFTREGNLKAIQYFEHAIRIQPDFGLAYAGLSINYAPMIMRGFITAAEGRPKIRLAAERALALEDSSPEAYTALASAEMADWDWSDAERSLKRALQLNPNYLDAYGWYGFVLDLLGRSEDGLALRRREITIDPVSDYASKDLGTALIWAGRPAEAIAQLLKALELRPDFAPARIELAHSYLAMNRLQEAHDQFVAANDPFDAAYVRALQGDTAPARKLLAGSKDDHLHAQTAKALLSLVLGDREHALTYLERACDEAAAGILFLKVDKRFAPLRNEPRFERLLERMHLIDPRITSLTRR